MALSEQSDALAFTVDYGSDPNDQDAPPVTLGHRKAVYVYRHVRSESSVEYREIPQADLAARFGTTSLDELLTPAKLKQIVGN